MSTKIRLKVGMFDLIFLKGSCTAPPPFVSNFGWCHLGFQVLGLGFLSFTDVINVILMTCVCGIHDITSATMSIVWLHVLSAKSLKRYILTFTIVRIDFAKPKEHVKTC